MNHPATKNWSTFN